MHQQASQEELREVAQFYIENSHPAIIPRDTFQRVQEEIARRSAKRRVSEKALTEKGKYSGKYALSELLECGECGTRYKRVTWARKGNKKIVWRCINRLENGTRHCKTSPTIEETRLHDAILRAISKMLEVKDEVLAALDDTLQVITGAGASQFDRVAAQQKIAELETLASDILALTKENGTASDFFEGKLAELYDQRAGLLDELNADDKRRANSGANSARLESLMASIRNAPTQIDDYEDAFVREYIEKIAVIDADNLAVTFKGGFEIQVEILV